MPISATGSKSEAGFTLIELMVVITIIGIASAAVVLAIPDPRGSVRAEGERFAARAYAARDGAIVEARDTSLYVTAQGYGFERRVAGRWQPAGDSRSSQVAWQPGTNVALGVEGKLRASFDSTGAASAPVRVQLARDGAVVTVAIAGDGDIRVE